MQSKYWEQESLFSEKLFTLEESFEVAETILKKVVNTMHEDSEKIGISLTGGFDGRAILSLINRAKEDLLLYSFGIPESNDVKVPMKISKQLSYKYFPIYLDGNYGHTLFGEYAKKAILFSDGRSSLARAHYPYVFELLKEKTQIVLTGICGSELLRAVRQTGVVISDNIKLLYEIPAARMHTIFDNFNSSRYYNKTCIDRARPSVLASMKNIKSSNDSQLTLSQKLYIFIVKEVFRKYFGVEISMESPFIYNRFPFLDYEFVDFIFKTPLCGANYKFFVQNPFVRIHGLQFYSRIINKNNKILSEINTDRMYAPHDLLTKRGRIKAGLAYYYRKLFEKPKDEYSLTLGIKHFIPNNLGSLKDNEFVNLKKIIEDYNNGNWENNKIEFYKALSFAIWYNHYFV